MLQTETLKKKSFNDLWQQPANRRRDILVAPSVPLKLHVAGQVHLIAVTTRGDESDAGLSFFRLHVYHIQLHGLKNLEKNLNPYNFLSQLNM